MFFVQEVGVWHTLYLLTVDDLRSLDGEYGQDRGSSTKHI